jgi:SAM-dependent methyltransferase
MAVTSEKFKTSYFDKFKKVFPSLTEEEFVGYFNEAKYGGYPEEPGGSIWDSEGKSIYVLIRILKPKKILEIGNFLGRSSNHILQAVEKNGNGKVVLLDIEERLEYDKLHNQNFERVLDDSLHYLGVEELDFDLYVQDGCHEYLHVDKELGRITTRTKNDFYIWSHDWFTVRPPQCEVQRAWMNYIDQFEVTSPMIDSVSNCGFVVATYKKK